MFRNTLTALLVLSTASAAFGADEKITIKVKYAPGTYVMTVKRDVNTTTDLGSGRTINQDMSNVTVMEITTDKPGPKDQKVRITYKRIKRSMDSGSRRMSFDSEDQQDQTPPMMGMGIYRAMVDKTLHLTLDSEGKVIEVTGMGEVLGGLAELNLGTIPVLENIKKQVGDQMMKMFGQTQKFLPKKPIAKGDTWIVDIKQAVPGLGELDLKQNCKLKDILKTSAGKVAVVDFTGKMTSDKPMITQTDSGAKMQVKDVNIEQSGTMKIHLDNTVRTDMTVKMKMKSVVMVTVPGPQNQQMTIKVRTRGTVQTIVLPGKYVKPAPASRPTTKPAAVEHL